MKTLASSVRSALVSASEVTAPVRFRRGSVVYDQGASADCLFLIESGIVKLTRARRNGGEAQILAFVGAHQILGEDCLSETNRVHNLGAHCVTDVMAYEISIVEVRRLLGIPIVASTLLNQSLDRTRSLIDRAEQREQFDVLRRLLCGLAEIARLIEPSEGGYPIPMRQNDIANFIGATRETTSSKLGILRQEKLVRLSRCMVTTVHPDILLAAAHDRLSEAYSA